MNCHIVLLDIHVGISYTIHFNFKSYVLDRVNKIIYSWSKQQITHLIKEISLCTSLTSLCHSTSRPFLNLCIIWLLLLLCLISSTFFIASIVLFHKSLLYLIGAFLRFSNSNDGSIANSLPAVLRYALVHLVLRGFFFFLNAAWHLERQNLKICSRLG